MSNKVTMDQIHAKIKSESYIVLPDGRTTLCMLVLENGFTINGTSACVDEANFDISLGRRYAHEDAIRQIWPLEGYLLAQRLHENPPVTLTVPMVLEEAKKQLDVEIEKAKQAKFKLSPQRVQAMKKAGVWQVKEKRNKMIAAYAKHDAPWGFKKDGTPKKRPGRAPREA